MRKIYGLALIAVAACGTKSNGTNDLSMSMGDLAQVHAGGGDMTGAPARDMTSAAGDMTVASFDMAHVAGLIPDPGNARTPEAFPWPDIEPNNTPATAVPMGTDPNATFGTWFDPGTNKIGGTDTADYYVFKSSGTAGYFTLGGTGICWSGGTNLLDATLYKVVAGVMQTPAVHVWNSTNTSCETSTQTDAAIEANTVYLLALNAVNAPVSTGFTS